LPEYDNTCANVTGLNRDVKSGYLQVGEILNSAVFYVFYPAKNNNTDASIIMWLQGGPGCASTIGMHTEFGPYYVDCTTPPCKEVERITSWNDHMHLLVVD